jgi:dephospho-CoA kinase
LTSAALEVRSDYPFYKEKRMYIIGVAGGTGSGKSTLCKILAEKIPNSEIIDGDALMNATLDACGGFFSRLLGETLQWDDEWRVKVNYFSEHPDRISEAIAIALRYITGGSLAGFDKCLVSAIEAARGHISGSISRRLESLPAKTRAVIIDWANLPALDIWKSCDLKIIVTADDAQRLARVKGRSGSRAFSDAELQNLVAYAALPYDKIECSVRVHNDNMKVLEHAAKKILNNHINQNSGD